MQSENVEPARVTPYHPPLLALIPVLGLYAQNAGKVPCSVVVRAGIVLVVGTCVTWVILAAILGNRRKGALAASVLIFAALPGWTLLEYSIETLTPLVGEGHELLWIIAYWVWVVACFSVAVVMHKGMGRAALLKLIGGVVVGSCLVFLAARMALTSVFGTTAAWLIVMYVVGAATAFVLVLWREGGFRRLTRTTNWFAGILVLLFLANCFYQYPWGPSRIPSRLEMQAAQTAPETGWPDIYFLVLDGYARSDVLRVQYHYNNGPFLDSLGQTGFGVAERGSVNYPNSLLSLASCLNMDYLHNLVPEPEASTAGIEDVAELGHNNRLYTFLKEQGYTLMAFSPGMAMREPGSMVDVCLGPSMALSEFDMVLLNSIAPGRVIGVIYHYLYGSAAYWPHAFLRRRFDFLFKEVTRVAERETPEPKFVLAQLTLPGPPFIFGRDGSWSTPDAGTQRMLSETFRGTPADFQERYRSQLHYVNTLIEQAVDAITARSARPAVILVASSHGPLLRTDAGQLDRAGLQEVFGALIAARFPEGYDAGDSALDDSVSLVNLFRVILNRVFGTGLPLLPDEIHAPSPDKPFDGTPLDGRL